MVARAGLISILLSIFYSLSVNAQRGCPQQSCDLRGLNCQTDFQVNTSKVSVVWRADLGTSQPDILQNSGCVGNNVGEWSALVVCPFQLGNLRTYMSLNYGGGWPVWYDTLLTSAGLPVTNPAGGIVAVDSQHMVMRLANGSMALAPTYFKEPIGNVSSLMYIDKLRVFCFVSYQSGGIYMYDPFGFLIATEFLIENGSQTNQSVSVWIPVNKLVVNTDVDPPCAYFVAQNNVTMKYRIYAVNFNYQPPYLLEKWHIDVEPYSTNVSDVRAVRMMARGNTLFCGLDSNRTLAIEDMGKSGKIKQSVPVRAISFASFDYPSGSERRFRDQDSKPIVWFNSGGVIYGWDSYGENDQFKYKLDLAQMYTFKKVTITSEIMVFGYHPEETTLVVGIDAIQASRFIRQSGIYVVALKVLPDGTVNSLWILLIGSENSKVTGQVIGVRDSNLVFTTIGQKMNSAFGIRLGE